MERIADALLRRRLWLAGAESCTGGLLAARITDVPGSSAYFLGGVVAYANAVKQDLLKVPLHVLREHGAVSAECAMAMAEGTLDLMGAGIALATTGIAGPGGGSPAKPVGLVYVAVAGRDAATRVQEHRLSGTRDHVRERTVDAALALLSEALSDNA